MIEGCPRGGKGETTEKQCHRFIDNIVAGIDRVATVAKLPIQPINLSMPRFASVSKRQPAPGINENGHLSFPIEVIINIAGEGAMGYPAAILQNGVLGRIKRLRRDDGLCLLFLAEQKFDKIQDLSESVVRKHGQLVYQLCFEWTIRIHL
jgi:hypothetical protein